MLPSKGVAVKISCVATAVHWGNGEVFLGLADRARARGLRQLCEGKHSKCALINTGRHTLPLHLVEMHADIPVVQLHEWSDGSREVSVELPGQEGQTPHSRLENEVSEGWILALHLSPGAEKRLRELLCADSEHDFADLYNVIRRLAGEGNGARSED